MPELPEVETILRGIEPHILGQPIEKIIIRNASLRWPINLKIGEFLSHHSFNVIVRRGKYLLLTSNPGTLIIHLGMSGSLRILTENTALKKHDHVDIHFKNRKILRFNDPRRFGAFIWTDTDPQKHPLIKPLGVEPLSNTLTGEYLWQLARRRKICIKSFIMNSRIVVGVGNIYAAESLFLAGIHPKTSSSKISLASFDKLTKAIKKVLNSAIQNGGTTLKDFIDSNGQPGYFYQKLKVYGREGKACVNCRHKIKRIIIAKRSTFFCSHCQI